MSKKTRLLFQNPKKKKKQWSVLQKRTIFKLPATHSKHTDTHPCTNTAMRYSFLRGRLPPTGVLRKKKAEFTALWKCPCWDRPGPSSCRLAEARCPRCGPRSRDRPLQGKSCLSFRAFPPAKIRQPLPAWHSSRKPLETNPNYPCCRTWRIQAHFAAWAAHFPASVSNSPHPQCRPRSAQVATPPTGPVRLHSKLRQEERHWSLPGLTHVLQVGVCASDASPPRSWCCSFCLWHRQPVIT